jgi:hypothetical protein
MRAAVVVERDLETGEVPFVLPLHLRDQFRLRPAFLLGADHDRRAVRIIGAEVDALVATQTLETDPDVGLDVFDQMPQVDRPVRVGQGGGDQDAASGWHGTLVWVGGCSNSAMRPRADNASCSGVR